MNIAKSLRTSIYYNIWQRLHEQAAATVIIALIPQKKQVKEKERKNSETLETLKFMKLCLRLEDKHNYKNYLQMTSKNFEKIFQLIIKEE